MCGRWLVLAVVEHTGQGVHSRCEMGRKVPLVGLEGTAARGLLPKQPEELGAASWPSTGDSLLPPVGWRGPGPVWPAYRGLAGI